MSATAPGGGAVVLRWGGRSADGRPGLVALAFSTVGHATALLAVVVAARTPGGAPPPGPVRVRLVAAAAVPPTRGAAPAAAPALRRLEPVPRTPLPEPTPDAPVPLGARPAEPEPEEQPPPEAPPARRRDPPRPPEPPPREARPAPESDAPPPAAGEDPAAGPAAGGDAAQVGSLRARGEGDTGHAYLERLVRQVSRSWVKPRGGNPTRSAVVYFEVARSGAVGAIRLEQGSGASLFDRSALRAVQLASPVPPLPPDATSATLKVHFEFIP